MTFSKDKFSARFVAARDDSAVKTEFRVSGRIAFPDRRGLQPKAGETWIVSIAAENPKKTVFFLTCHELAPAVDTTSTPSTNPPSTNAAPKTSQSKPPAPVKTVSPAPSTPAVETATLFVPDYLFAPGGDAYEQAKSWTTRVTKTDLTNLRFAHAQLLASSDSVALALQVELTTLVGAVDASQDKLNDLTAQTKRLYSKDLEAARALYAAKVEMSEVAREKGTLAVDTLSYARLVKRIKVEGDSASSTLVAEAESFKTGLDARRAAHSTRRAAAKQQFDDADLGRLFASNSEDVEAGVVLLEELAKAEVAVQDAMSALATGVKRYEDHVHSLRHPG
ncbi:MAG: hypothetical protein IAF58_06205 [Leptolyngbya sp.]|nr:hypothetical protein [Candidatus Melainabacteria bacterium]